MITQASELADLIEATIVVDQVVVSPNLPPATDKCSAAYVWGSRIFDSPSGVVTRGDDAGCLFRRAYEIRYRVDLCYEPRADGREHSVADALEKATEFYDMLDAVWCAITAAASSGELFISSSCEDIVVGALEVSPPQGDRVSAEGYVLVTFPCVVVQS